MSTYSKLEFAPAHRPGEKLGKYGYKTQRHFLDLLIDGESLYEAIKARQLDNISPFWLEEAAGDPSRSTGIESAERLMLIKPADFPNDRRSLFICPECGDLGCGAVSVVVEMTDESIVWREFGYENNWENKVLSSSFKELGPFTFRPTEYLEMLNDIVARLRRS
ncbi:MAG TPA: hypothetical protein VIL63_02205 [Terriglobales bacterium]